MKTSNYVVWPAPSSTFLKTARGPKSLAFIHGLYSRVDWAVTIRWCHDKNESKTKRTKPRYKLDYVTEVSIRVRLSDNEPRLGMDPTRLDGRTNKRLQGPRFQLGVEELAAEWSHCRRSRCHRWLRRFPHHQWQQGSTDLEAQSLKGQTITDLLYFQFKFIVFPNLWISSPTTYGRDG